MKLPRLDTTDSLVLIAVVGVAVMVRGVGMISPAWAWITAGVAMIGWAVWRMR